MKQRIANVAVRHSVPIHFRGISAIATATVQQ